LLYCQVETIVSANIDVSRLPHRTQVFKRTPDDRAE